MLDIDTAIKHCLEVAECNEIAGLESEARKRCSNDHRQLAEWLMELKDLRAEQNDQYVFIHELMSELKESKRLLKAAVDDIYKARQGCNCNICDMPPEPIERCQYENGEDCQFKWRYADEALKIIES